MKVTIKQEIDATEFWSNIWGASPESFGSHWTMLYFNTGSDWDKIGTVRVAMIDPEDVWEEKEIKKTICLQDLVDAYEKCWSGEAGIHRSYLDLDNLDCVGADGIIQTAVLGKVIYG